MNPTLNPIWSDRNTPCCSLTISSLESSPSPFASERENITMNGDFGQYKWRCIRYKKIEFWSRRCLINRLILRHANIVLTSSLFVSGSVGQSRQTSYEFVQSDSAVPIHVKHVQYVRVEHVFHFGVAQDLVAQFRVEISSCFLALQFDLTNWS